MNYIPKIVATKADIDKQIEIEVANLMYLEFKNKDDAFKEARAYVEEKYKDVIQELKSQGKY